jgi:hypothetical protein
MENFLFFANLLLNFTFAQVQITGEFVYLLRKIVTNLAEQAHLQKAAHDAKIRQSDFTIHGGCQYTFLFVINGFLKVLLFMSAVIMAYFQY